MSLSRPCPHKEAQGPDKQVLSGRTPMYTPCTHPVHTLLRKALLKVVAAMALPSPPQGRAASVLHPMVLVISALRHHTAAWPATQLVHL